MLDFERPALLLLLPVACALVGFGCRGTLTHWARTQRRVALAARLGILSLVLIAAAGPRIRGLTHLPMVVYLRDVSASAEGTSETARAFIDAATSDHVSDSAEMEFAAGVTVRRAFGEKSPRGGEPPAADDTQLAGALRFTAGLLPLDRPGRVVLLSDGRVASNPDILAAAGELAGRGIEVDCVPLDPPTRIDAALAGLNAPADLREGDAFDLKARVFLTTPGNATVRLFQNDLAADEITRDFPAGESEVVFRNLSAMGRSAKYAAEIMIDGDSQSANNRRAATVVHSGAAKVLIIDPHPSELDAIAGALRSGGFEVDVRPPAGLPESGPELNNFDLVIFSDAPAAAFRDSQFVNLAKWVNTFGGGFVMAGGGDSFGAGGYFRTPIATLLPVKIEREDREETPVVALLVVLDRSGSMTAAAPGGVTKMDLANQGAEMALEVLQGKDLFGLFAVDTRVQTVIPLARVTDRSSLAKRIAGITAGGGGIYIYTSLAAAFPLLRDAQAGIRHAIVFSDAADAEEKNSGGEGGGAGGASSLTLAGAFLANHITISVVALGTEQDKDTAFLRELAAQGGGRFYLTGDATTLPRIFTQETMKATQSSLREDVFPAVAGAPSEITRGIEWATAPPLLGLNTSSAKPGAEVLLKSTGDEPVLVTWRVGLGQVGAFLSDVKPKWSAEWMNWGGFGKLWAQAARKLARPSQRADLSATVREEPDELVIKVDAVTAEGLFRNGLEVTVAAAGGAPAVRATQDAPGHYVARVPKPAAGGAFLAVCDGTGRPAVLSWTKNFPAEYLAGESGDGLLREIATRTGGMFSPDASATFRPSLKPTGARFDLAPWLLAAALLLWPVDIWLRRRDWNLQRARVPAG